METPFLRRRREGFAADDGGWTRWWPEFRAESRRLGAVAAPMVAMNLAQFAVQATSNAMVGHLGGVLPLSSAAVATSLAAVSGFSLLIGLASGLETLCGQAFGAEQYDRLSVYAYRAILTLLVVCLPISLFWLYVADILTFVGIDPMISAGAGRYMAWMIPGVFAYAFLQPITKFLQAQSLILPMLIAAGATLCIHVPLCWLLVFRTGLGNVGGALSIGVSYWLNVVMLAGYIGFSESCKATRSPLTVEAFWGINEFLRLALPSALMMCLEWWSFELLILLSGLLPNPELETSVLSISLTSITLIYTIPYGIGAAASTRVSNELGASNPDAARSAVRVAICITVSVAIVVGGTLLASRHLLGYAYSNEKEVVDYVARIIPLVCISVLTDSIQGVLSGVARGCGWQHLGAYVNLGSFYIVGIPVALLLGFILRLRGWGLWAGIVCGSTTQAALLSLITCFTNWRQMAEAARARVFHEKKTANPDEVSV